MSEDPSSSDFLELSNRFYRHTASLSEHPTKKVDRMWIRVENNHGRREARRGIGAECSCDHHEAIAITMFAAGPHTVFALTQRK